MSKVKSLRIPLRLSTTKKRTASITENPSKTFQEQEDFQVQKMSTPPASQSPVSANTPMTLLEIGDTQSEGMSTAPTSQNPTQVDTETTSPETGEIKSQKTSSTTLSGTQDGAKTGYQYQPYTKAHVLSLIWEGAEPARRADTQALTTLFEEKFNFITEAFTIPEKSSHSVVEERIEEFIGSFAGPQSFLIVYYNGHGKMMQWLQNYTWLKELVGDDSSPSVNWLPLQEKLRRCGSDVMIILDADESGGSYKDIFEVNVGPRVELLSATGDEGAEGVARPPGEGSFTWFLIKTLRAIADDPARLESATACSLLRNAYTVMFEHSWYGGGLAPTSCTHLFISKMDQPSIPLRKLPKPTSK